jgi:hypothetical protein
MSAEFERDLSRVQNAVAEARNDLMAVLARLHDSDLPRSTRGGWPVRKVLEHLLQSEWMYVALANHLRGTPRDTPEARGVTIGTMRDAISGLEGAHGLLLRATEGIDEETFYKLQQAGHEEYSFLSVLENVELHDREHAAQIERILAASAD